MRRRRASVLLFRTHQCMGVHPPLSCWSVFVWRTRNVNLGDPAASKVPFSSLRRWACNAADCVSPAPARPAQPRCRRVSGLRRCRCRPFDTLPKAPALSPAPAVNDHCAVSKRAGLSPPTSATHNHDSNLTCGLELCAFLLSRCSLRRSICGTSAPPPSNRCWLFVLAQTPDVQFRGMARWLCAQPFVRLCLPAQSRRAAPESGAGCATTGVVRRRHRAGQGGRGAVPQNARSRMHQQPRRRCQSASP